MTTQEVESTVIDKTPVESEAGKHLTTMMKKATTTRLNLDQIFIHKSQNVRQVNSYSEEELQEMIAQIEGAGGLLQPIGVAPIKPHPDTDNKHYILVWGYRRALALTRMAETEPEWGQSILCQVVNDGGTSGTTRLVQMMENMARKDLSPMEIAIGVKEALEDKESDLSQKDISRLLGRSEANISQLLKLNQLPKEVQDLVSTGKLSFSHARLILFNTSIPEADWTNLAKKGADMMYEDFKEFLEDKYAEGSDDEDKKDGKEGTGSGSKQKAPQILRATELQAKYLPFIKERVEKADASAKVFTAKDLAQARLDTLNTVLLNQGTELAKEIAPHLEELKKAEEKEKADADANKAEEKFYKECFKRAEEIRKAAMANPAPDAEVPTWTQAYIQVGKEVYSKYSDAKATDLGFALNVKDKAFADTFTKKLAETHKEVVADREEAKKKKEERDAKKKAEEAKTEAEKAAGTTASI